MSSLLPSALRRTHLLINYIAHVMIYLFPKLQSMPFLWLLTDRRAIIVMFVLGISYPLSLYRDIAKVCCFVRPQINCVLTTSQLAKASALALISMLVILITVISQSVRLSPQEKGDISNSLFINSGVFQAIGVISFGQYFTGPRFGPVLC